MRTLTVVFCLFALNAWSASPLIEYVRRPDPSFRFGVVDETGGEGYRVGTLRMTSQNWLTPQEVDQTEWWHWVHVVIPEEVEKPTALLFIGGGSNRDETPDEVDASMIELAMATQSVVASLSMVPNQPLKFHGSDEGLYEDALIAYGWDQFLKTDDPRWLARLPMTKSAVRAMDTVVSYVAQAEPEAPKVEDFVVAGASKRGWTTWTTAIADPRVRAIAPIVIDMLNVVPSFDHHWQALGFYSVAVQDYENMNIQERMDTPEFQKLLKIVEPYEYRDQLTMPKLLINGASDEFFLPDSWRFYFKDLPGPKGVRYVPNAGHGLDGSDAPETLTAYHALMIAGEPIPEVTWELTEGGVLEAKTDTAPRETLVWRATNPKARDFRLPIIGQTWESEAIKVNGDGLYSAELTEPDEGWTASFIEFTYELDAAPTPLKLTTGIYVTPDTLPYDLESRATSTRVDPLAERE